MSRRVTFSVLDTRREGKLVVAVVCAWSYRAILAAGNMGELGIQTGNLQQLHGGFDSMLFVILQRTSPIRTNYLHIQEINLTFSGEGASHLHLHITICFMTKLIRKLCMIVNVVMFAFSWL